MTSKTELWMQSMHWVSKSREELQEGTKTRMK